MQAGAPEIERQLRCPQVRLHECPRSVSHDTVLSVWALVPATTDQTAGLSKADANLQPRRQAGGSTRCTGSSERTKLPCTRHAISLRKAVELPVAGQELSFRRTKNSRCVGRGAR